MTDTVGAMAKVRSRIRKALAFLSAPLIGLALASAVVMSIANPDPSLREWLCSTGICFRSNASHWWNNLFYDVAVACLMAVVFFWLLVRLPEYQKRERIKRSFRIQYRDFKLACIENFLAVADGGFDARLPETLLPIDAFREYFKQDVGEGQSRWHRVANNMTPYYLEATLLRMEALRREISLLMHVTDISESDAFELLKRLSEAMLMQRGATIEYDSIKSFLKFFWNLFAGWDFVEGYRARDIVEEFIDAI